MYLQNVLAYAKLISIIQLSLLNALTIDKGSVTAEIL